MLLLTGVGIGLWLCLSGSELIELLLYMDNPIYNDILYISLTICYIVLQMVYI